MSRPPRARDTVLDAYERILVEDGARGATLDATARAAGVSKGGLLYHYASKDALQNAVVERLRALVEADIATIESAPEGAVAYFVRSSVMEDDELDRAIVATSRLAQSGHSGATAALVEMREAWESVLRPHVRDAAALDLVMLVSDGLYFNNALGGDTPLTAVPQGAALDALVELVVGIAAE
ncbi:TetR/AcrR family transcriptional regulator [Microbacterium sp. ASV49]|uniref:TetR/AcrR family transcriptional regulator n=1 Tax=Microbacterium candidum TaxID=3041922 RepID=A0ABT7N086_9MICO|nr:TetR/AcrR family transcriptional regulator [Microbacterium sp. ASV49]MDL9980114.1 TetR/AcrR family transcriptional regulator [Microbacterium sp. ASV49]